MRPIRPDPGDYVKIQKAFRAAKLMKWWSPFLMGLSLIFSIILGHYTVWYLGLGLLMVLWSALLIGGYSQARCPHCGQVWWSRLVLIFIAPWWLLIGMLLSGEDDDETETFVCRRCRLDIGVGLK